MSSFFKYKIILQKYVYYSFTLKGKKESDSIWSFWSFVGWWDTKEKREIKNKMKIGLLKMLGNNPFNKRASHPKTKVLLVSTNIYSTIV